MQFFPILSGNLKDHTVISIVILFKANGKSNMAAIIGVTGNAQGHAASVVNYDVFWNALVKQDNILIFQEVPNMNQTATRIGVFWYQPFHKLYCSQVKRKQRGFVSRLLEFSRQSFFIFLSIDTYINKGIKGSYIQIPKRMFSLSHEPSRTGHLCYNHWYQINGNPILTKMATTCINHLDIHSTLKQNKLGTNRTIQNTAIVNSIQTSVP